MSDAMKDLLINKIAVELFGTFAEQGCFCDISKQSVLSLSERITDIVEDIVDC